MAIHRANRLVIAEHLHPGQDDPVVGVEPFEDWHQLFADLPEAIANTMVVAQRCAMMAPSRKPILPRFAETLWLEPVWKMMWSNKAVLAVLWDLFPGHPNLLPASFDPAKDLTRWTDYNIGVTDMFDVKMSGGVIGLKQALLLCALLSGCATNVNTYERAESQASPNYVADKRVITDNSLAGTFRVVGPTLAAAKETQGHQGEYNHSIAHDSPTLGRP